MTLQKLLAVAKQLSLRMGPSQTLQIHWGTLMGVGPQFLRQVLVDGLVEPVFTLRE